MGTVFVAQLVNDLCPHGNFQPFNGIEYEQAQFPVKHVQVIHHIPCRAFLEVVNDCAALLFLIGQHIGTEPIIADVGEQSFRPWYVRNRHAP